MSGRPTPTIIFTLTAAIIAAHVGHAAKISVAVRDLAVGGAVPPPSSGRLDTDASSDVVPWVAPHKNFRSDTVSQWCWHRRSVIGASMVVIALLIVGYRAWVNSTWKLSDVLACCVYVGVAVAIDISIVSQREIDRIDGYVFNPMCVVFIVEIVKLAVSLVLYLGSRAPGSALVPAEFCAFSDGPWFLLTALVFSCSHLLVWWAIAENDLAAFGVFQQTMVFWTAAIWMCVFRRLIGKRRAIGIGVIFVGLMLNRAHVFRGHAWSWAAGGVVLMTLCSALGIVINEKAMKQNKALDINFQNSILYAMCAALTIVPIMIDDRRPHMSHTSFHKFFEGFRAMTCCTICLQALAGLIVARLLKYTDAVLKTVACCLRGPIIVLVAPHVVSVAHDMTTVASAMIVAAGCLMYLQQGPLSELSAPAETKTMASSWQEQMLFSSRLEGGRIQRERAAGVMGLASHRDGKI